MSQPTTTPESVKTVSVTSQAKAAQGPTPKNEFKVPMNQRNHFSSPTDAMVSPCTQKLMQSRRMPRKIAPGSQKPRIQSYKASSELANKENKMKYPLTAKGEPLKYPLTAKREPQKAQGPPQAPADGVSN